MNIEDFKKALNAETEHLDFMLSRYQIDENFSIKANNAHHNDWETPDELKINQFDLSATFYGQDFDFVLLRKRIEDDINSFSYIEALNQNKLMESFSDAIEEDYWEHIKTFCLRWEELEIIDYSE